jgi:aminoglycoside phosphotransferase (APT) family kinase protein
VLPWLPGAPADLRSPRADQAPVFAAFLRALHRPAPADAPRNPVRGVPLAERAPVAEGRLARLAAATDLVTPQLRALWAAALAAPPDHPAVWLHGELHPRNLLVEDGALSAVIDWGDITAGDPATDLAAVWMLFEDPQARAACLAAYGPAPPATLARARGWAIHLGATLLETGLVDEPRHAAIGERTLRRLLEDG